jgi:pimeloyl-ACP methyl ester carboxylesterase
MRCASADQNFAELFSGVAALIVCRGFVDSLRGNRELISTVFVADFVVLSQDGLFIYCSLYTTLLDIVYSGELLAKTYFSCRDRFVSAASFAADTVTSPCRLPEFPQELRCGKVQRPLNPAEPGGKKIDVHYVVLPSQDKNKLPDAVFLLAGGPGQSAISVAGFGQAMLSRLNKRRDLVFVDQRGTGRSASLACPELENSPDVADDVQMQKQSDACLARLKTLPHGDLRFYSTSIAVQDIEAVRKQQAYDRINLVGASYGTRVGLEFARQFPLSVKRMVLDGVVPPDMSLPAADAQAAWMVCFRIVPGKHRATRLIRRWHSNGKV